MLKQEEGSTPKARWLPTWAQVAATAAIIAISWLGRVDVIISATRPGSWERVVLTAVWPWLQPVIIVGLVFLILALERKRSVQWVQELRQEIEAVERARADDRYPLILEAQKHILGGEGVLDLRLQELEQSRAAMELRLLEKLQNIENGLRDVQSRLDARE